MKRDFTYRIEYETDTTTGTVVATIPELNHLSSFGNSFAEAEAHIKEAALGYIETLVIAHKKIPEPAFHTEGTYLRLLIPQAA